MLEHTNHKKPVFLHKVGFAKRPFRMCCDYRGDGIGTKNKSLKFLDDKKFQNAWSNVSKHFHNITGAKAPDVRWRAHIALWAACNGLKRDGDFVECGVYAGLFSGVICDYLDFANINKTFYLFDTWAGIPTDGLNKDEKRVADAYNGQYHNVDVFSGVENFFAPYPNCRLIRGELPGTLDTVLIDKVAYLSIDLNNATYERACIEVLWDRLVSGAIVLLDDYNFTVCRIQQDMWDDFAAENGVMVAALPTGQGIIIKP